MKDHSVINILIAVSLMATVVFVVLTCVMPYVALAWLALASGAVTLVLGIVRYFEW